MRTLTLLQGSPEWLAHRRTTRNASDASVMMGASPSISRRELVRLRAVGLEREHSDYVQKYILDRGHAVEPALRAYAEALIGQDLYPVTGVSEDGFIGASFDGVSLDDSIIFEAKQPSSEKFDCIEHGEIPPADFWQVVQQFAVCKSAQLCIYCVGDGTNENTRHLKIPRDQIEHDIPKLLAGWAQFDADVATYVPEETKPAPVAAVVEGFGALSLRIEGRVLASNLDAFKAGAEAFIDRLPKPEDLQTDQDFANAESAVRACEEAETRIKAAKDAAQAQMADVDAVFRMAETLAQSIRTARLALSKVVAAEKESRRGQIVQAGVDAVLVHYTLLNQSLGEYGLQPPASLRADMGAAIKGKRTISSLRDAIDSAVASEKIEASQTAERIRQNIAVLSEDAAGHETLFADRRQLVASKMPDDLRNLVKARIAEHQQREAERLEAERERIRQEEAARIERERAQQEKAQAAQQTDTTQRAIETEQQPSAVGGGVDGSTGELRAAGEPGIGIAKPPTLSGVTCSIGQINEWINPLSINADGLASLGFRPSAKKGAAKLYPAEDFPHICGALARLIAEAPARAAQKKAA